MDADSDCWEDYIPYGLFRDNLNSDAPPQVSFRRGLFEEDDYYDSYNDSSDEDDSEMYDDDDEDDEDDDDSDESEKEWRRLEKEKRKERRNPSSENPEEERNWLEMLPDVMLKIFMKLKTVDILFRVQSVCSKWWEICKEPQLYHCVDLQNEWDFYDSDIDMHKMTRVAVDRSCGQMAKFSVEHYPDDELFRYINYKCSSLKAIRLVSCYHVGDDALIEMAKKQPLEEIEIIFHSFSGETVEAVGRSCPLLKYFRLNTMGYKGDPYSSESEDEALFEVDEAQAIARSMSGLRHLVLFGSSMSDKGLRAILDGCPHLITLDLRHCFRLKFEGDLLKRCADRNIKVRLPQDSTDDYEFSTDYNGGMGLMQSSPDDYGYGYGWNSD